MSLLGIFSLCFLTRLCWCLYHSRWWVVEKTLAGECLPPTCLPTPTLYGFLLNSRCCSMWQVVRPIVWAIFCLQMASPWRQELHSCDIGICAGKRLSAILHYQSHWSCWLKLQFPRVCAPNRLLNVVLCCQDVIWAKRQTGRWIWFRRVEPGAYWLHSGWHAYFGQLLTKSA